MSVIEKKVLDEGNTILARFDGFEPRISGKKLIVCSKHGGGWGVLYDEDWVQLMNIVEKVEHEHGCRFFLESNEEHTKVRFTDMAIPGNDIVSIKHFGTKKHAIWLAVVEVVKKVV